MSACLRKALERVFRPKVENGVLHAVAGIVEKKGRLLLIKRGVNPYRGWWCLPGGFVEKGEASSAAIEREVFEETGIQAKAFKFVGVYKSVKLGSPNAHKPIKAVCYLMKPVGGKEKTTEEALELRWVSWNALPKKLAFNHAKMVEDARKLFSCIQTRRFDENI